MIRRIFLLFVLIGLGLSVRAQQLKMRDVLRHMPDSIVPYIKHNTILDFIDFMDSKMKAEVRNELEGKSEMTVLSDDYAAIKLSEAVSMQLKLLEVPTNVDSLKQIICLVKTYGTAAKESEISFYDTKWRSLHGMHHVVYNPEQLIHIADTVPADKRDEIEKSIDLITVEMQLSPEQPTLTVIAHTPVLNEDNLRLIKDILQQKTLKWDGRNFNIY